VHADDTDGDALSVTVSQEPQHGTVTITPGAGGNYTVTYTPDGQSRLDAYDGVGDTTDQFVITVNDGQQSVSKVVNVPVDKTEAAVTGTTSIGDSFEFPRGVAFDSNGNPIYTVSRPVDLGDLSSGGVVSLILANGDAVDVYNTQQAAPTLTAPKDVAVDDQGVTYVADPTTGMVTKFNGSTSAGSVDVHGDPIGLFTTPGGDVYAVVGSTDPTTFERVVSIYDVTNDTAVGTAYTGSDESKENLVDVAMTSGGLIYVTNPADDSVAVVGGAGPTSPISVGGKPTAIAVDPSDGRVFVTVNRVNGTGPSATGTLELVEITSGTATHVADLYTSGPGQASLNDGSDMAISGNRIYVTNIGVTSAGVASGSISVVDADSGALLDPISLGTNPYAQIPTRVVFSPDGSHAYVVSAYGSVSEISFANNANNAISV
jgi:large repetitive protein